MQKYEVSAVKAKSRVQETVKRGSAACSTLWRADKRCGRDQFDRFMVDLVDCSDMKIAYTITYVQYVCSSSCRWGEDEHDDEDMEKACGSCVETGNLSVISDS